MSQRSGIDPFADEGVRAPASPGLDLGARRLAIACGLYALAGGIVSFGGWGFDVRRLTDWNDAGVSILPNTALATACAGAGLLAILSGRCRAAAWLGAFVAAVGATVWLQNLTGIDLGIDRLFLFGRTWGNTGVLHVGRMGPPASASWVLLG